MFPSGSLTSSDIALLLFYLSALGALLIVGVLLRAKIALLKKIYMPASLIAGVIGVILGGNCLGVLPDEMTSTWGALPTSLIVVIFSTMLMTVDFSGVGNAREAKDLVISQLVMGTAGSFLQIGVPCLLTAFLLKPVFGVNDLFPSTVEVGWAGGHGTAGGMQEVYDNLGWTEGTSLALTSATIGLLVGIIGGMIIINHAARHGYLSRKLKHEKLTLTETQDFTPVSEKKANAYETVQSGVVESFAFHVALIGISIILGYVIKWALGFLVDGLPLFPMAMLGGFIINRVLSMLGLLKYVDAGTLSRISGVCLDLLVVAAVSSIQLSVIVDNAIPMIIVSIAALLTMLFYVYWMAPRLFKEDWFEQVIVHYGVNTGVTAVGFMLLRVVDPDLKTLGSKAYAIQAPFTSPVFGGGIVTALLPIAILNYGNVAVGVVALLILVASMLFARICGCWHKPDRSYKNL